MLLWLICTLLTGLIGIVVGALSFLAFLVPSQIANAFTTIFSYASLANGIFPMTDALAAILVTFGAFSLIYGAKIILWAYGLIRHGGNTELPKMLPESSFGGDTEMGYNPTMRTSYRKGVSRRNR